MTNILAKKTLVLNKFWTPVDVTTVFDAVNLGIRGAALFVDPSTCEVFTFDDWIRRPVRDEYIRTVRYRFSPPEVALLTRFDKYVRRRVPFTKKNVLLRDQNHCQYCGKKFPLEELTVDHIIPRSKGGPTTWLNCVTSCRSCNLKKGSKSVQDARMKLLQVPVPPAWESTLMARLGPQLERLSSFLERNA